MAEPIDRLELMENLADLIFDEPNSDYFKGVRDAQRVVSEMPIYDGWIPTADQLPTEDGLYRVTVHPDYLTPDMYPTDDVYWIDGKWKYVDVATHKSRMPTLELFDYTAEIIAWKPLENPYVEKGGE